MNRDMLGRRLRRRGFEILIAGDGRGHRRGDARSPDLDADGPEPAGARRLGGDAAPEAAAATAAIPVLALTAHAMADRSRAGARGRLRRPRHQADRHAAAARQDRAAARRRGQARWLTGPRGATGCPGQRAAARGCASSSWCPPTPSWPTASSCTTRRWRRGPGQASEDLAGSSPAPARSPICWRPPTRCSARMPMRRADPARAASRPAHAHSRDQGLRRAAAEEAARSAHARISSD